MRPWSVVLCAVLGSGSTQAATLIPWQGSASLAAGLGRSPAEGAAFFMGHTWGRGEAGRPIPFTSLGGELTLAGPRPTYDMALGLQLRAGVAWGRPVGAGRLWPDLMLFARAAPFVGASSRRPGEAEPAGVRRAPTVGLRVGVGVTAGGWTQWLLREGFPEDGEGTGVIAEAARVVTGLVLLPLAFLNHLELTAELAGPQGGKAEGLLALRVGSGF